MILTIKLQRMAHGRKREKGDCMMTNKVVRSISLDSQTACTHSKRMDFLTGSLGICDIVSLKARRIPTV